MEYKLIESNIQKKNLTPIARILTNRGIKYQDIEHYLCTTDEDILDPSLIDNLITGIKMLISHINNNDKILIQVDSDCDGYTSAATLINYLYFLFPSFVENNISYQIHQGKEHGIILKEIPKDISLLIVPDAGSNDYDQHEGLAAAGVDILIIDHHEAGMISDYACIINNQLCDYPTKSLSGAGMVYKFCQEIDKIMNLNYANRLLDLVALGIIADVMDLRDFETKHLINLGLSHIENPFFQKMIEKNSYYLSDLTPTNVAFYVAPYVNATIRMGTQEEKMILFESMLSFKANQEIPSTKRGCKGQTETIVEQAVRNSSNIKNRQTKARDNNLEIIEQLIKENDLLKNKILIVQIPKEKSIEKNLTGLIANQLMSKYQKPVLLLNESFTVSSGTQELSWEGSARGYDKSFLQDFRAFVNDSNLLMYAEGHKNAFGFGIKDKNVQAFIKYCNEALKDKEFTPCYLVDFIFNADDFNPNDILTIAELKSLWGQGIEEPLIALERIKISQDNITLMSPDKSPTIKITLPNGVSLIKFKSSQEEYDKLSSQGLIVINAVGKCEKNVWSRKVSAQILIEDYDIIQSIKYYF